MRITDEFYITEREFKIIETDSLPVDIPRFVTERITLYIDGKIYNGTLTMMHYIPKDRKAEGLPYLVLILVESEKDDTLKGKMIQRIFAEGGWTYIDEEMEQFRK